MGRQIGVEQALLPEHSRQELQSVCAELRTLSFLQMNRADSCVAMIAPELWGLHTRCWVAVSARYACQQLHHVGSQIRDLCPYITHRISLRNP